MRRREFIAGSMSAAIWPIGASAEQAHPRIGFLHQGGLPTPPLMAAFRSGLREGGASPDIEIDHRAADGDYNRLPALVADLVNRRVSVIIVGLAARYAVPSMYPTSEYVIAGGLMSYGASLRDAFHQTGLYVAKILAGATPSDLPILQSAKFELMINLRTAKSLGIAVPAGLLALADEVIE